jgi:hypothetical protein
MVSDIRAALSVEAPLEERIHALHARLAAMSEEEFTRRPTRWRRT